MLKKLFAAVIAATMVLGLVSFASAAAPSFPDTLGIPEETQIATLKALGIVTGDEQGRFNPNGTFTRAQMAVIAVKLMGYGDTAAYLQQPTPFPDVTARHQWAWGYINLAIGQEIITGRPDGTFGPDDPATYVDVVVLLLRILGYEPTLVGSWPTKYLVKAAQVGLTKGVSFSIETPATRRAVAVMAYNALTIPKVVRLTYGTEAKYVVSGTENTSLQTLLDNLGSAPVEGWLVSSPELFDGKAAKITINVGGTPTELDLAEGVDVAGLLGHKVKAWKNSDGQVFLVQDKSPVSSVKVAGFVDADTVEIDDENVDVAGVPMFFNYDGPAAIDATNNPLVDGGEITVIYDGDTPKYVVELNYTTGVVKSVSTIYETITWDTGSVLQLENKEVRWFGDAEELADLKANDVVQYIDGAEDAVLIVTRNAPTGTLTKMVGTKITVGGVEYSKAFDGTAPDITSLGGSAVKVLLNKDGQYFKVVALEAAAAPTTIAVVLQEIDNYLSIDGLQDYMKLLLPDGTKKTYPYSGDVATDGVHVGDIIEYSLDADGFIEANPTLLIPFGAGVGTNLSLNDDYNLVGGKLFTATTVVFNFYGTDFTDGDPLTVKTGNWDTLVAMANGLQGAITFDGAKATVVKITNGAAVTSDVYYGVVTGQYTAWDPNAQKVYNYVSILKKDGTVVDLVYKSGGPLTTKDVVSYAITGGLADFVKLTPDNADLADGCVWRAHSIDGSLLTLKAYNSVGAVDETHGENVYVLTADTQYVDLTGSTPKSAPGVPQGAKVKVYSVVDTTAGVELAVVVAIVK